MNKKVKSRVLKYQNCLFLIALAIFIFDTFLMDFLSSFTSISLGLGEIPVESTLLVLFVIPFIYHFTVKPLVKF